MISIYKIKPAFQKLLQPLLRGLYKAGITANQITIAAVILSIGMGWSFLYYRDYSFLILIIPIGYLVRMALNALDGMMANHYNMKSDLGEILNELGDVVSDAAIIFPLIILPDVHPVVIILFGVLAIVNEYAGILGKVISGERRYEGPMGKSDRALAIGLFCLIFYFWSDVTEYGNWYFGILAGLTALSTFIRIRKSLK